MDISSHLDKNNLHHAYLIEGVREEIVPEVLKFVKILGIETEGNPDFFYISTDSIKIEDARNLKPPRPRWRHSWLSSRPGTRVEHTETR